MYTGVSRRSRRALAPAVLVVAALSLTACGGGGSAEGSSNNAEAPSDFSLLVNSENSEVPTALTALSEDQCSAENEALPLSIETVPQTNLDQRLQLLAGQGGLPVQFSAGNAPDLTKTLDESGNILDLEQALTESGAIENFEPAAISTIENLYGGFKVLPYEYNIEGIWYNKQLFEEQGIEVPQTWDELVAAAEQFEQAGVTPFSASGEQGWPITRLIGNYIFRDLGPDAMQRVADGEAKLTDPEYVAAAQAVADLGEAGFFGEGVGSVDMDTSTNEFMNGNAAMFYMGSWALSDFGDAERNTIGEENIGFMPFPNVEGGAGSREQLAANVGLPIAVNANAQSEEVDSWLTCISENYGSTALEEVNRVSGFKANEPVETPPLVQTVQDQVSSTDETVLWFEALFNTKATSTSQTNAARLVTGNLSAEEFMTLVQNDLDQ